MKSYFDSIPSYKIHNYIIWRNNKDGAIIDDNNDGIYRFLEAKRSDTGDIKHYDYDINKIPIVAVGIVAFWLKHRNSSNRLFGALFTPKLTVIEGYKELFDKYTESRFAQFRSNNKDNPDTWEWDWDYEFYAKYVIPNEIELNKQSEALFEYISDEDISLATKIMKNYIAYLKKTRSGLGYVVNKELLVLRAINSMSVFQLEDLEDFEITTILDRLEENGYVQVAWIEGHGYEAVRLLDKGKVYLKELEEKVINKSENKSDHEDIKKGMDDKTTIANSNTNSQTPPEDKPEGVHEITWEERKKCFKDAVLHVMEEKKKDDKYLFDKGAKWIAPYRFAIDEKDIMYDKDDPKKNKDISVSQYEQFDKLAKELNLHDSSITREPYRRSYITQITKPTYTRFNQPFPWPLDGIKGNSFVLLLDMTDIYNDIKFEYEKYIEALKTRT